MKTKLFLLALTLTTALFFTSCNDEDEIPRPEITGFELGIDNNKTGHIGHDVHVDAKITAPGKIEKVRVVIHPEGEHESKSATFLSEEEEWKVDSIYTEFSGLKNATFHKHIDIPDYAKEGDYHFHFIVTDMEGNQASLDEELEIMHGDGHSH
ncbi:DUF4625 domain-containing protein [Mariniphaga sediminis]|uniref:DUF4625 domain-containing protein n=2 Tax=Mariniphaga sediminis TaxID=1628158 RepID=A0A399D3J2_9BACT|nr:DUF4625 domain-containing protein [Mariniphaga sediminis]RIH65232.1 DUF4625 domain-containing protein [Mariniphaga sediminis]